LPKVSILIAHLPAIELPGPMRAFNMMGKSHVFVLSAVTVLALIES
jgi:hypothetical protein